MTASSCERVPLLLHLLSALEGLEPAWNSDLSLNRQPGTPAFPHRVRSQNGSPSEPCLLVSLLPAQ